MYSSIEVIFYLFIIISPVFTIMGIWLMARMNKWGWGLIAINALFGNLIPLLYIWGFSHILCSNMLMYVLFFIVAMYGAYKWGQQTLVETVDEGHADLLDSMDEVKVNFFQEKVSNKEKIWVVISFVALTFLSFFFNNLIGMERIGLCHPLLLGMMVMSHFLIAQKNLYGWLGVGIGWFGIIVNQIYFPVIHFPVLVLIIWGFYGVGYFWGYNQWSKHQKRGYFFLLP